MPKVPSKLTLADLLNKPEVVDAAFALLEALANLNVQLVTAQSALALVPNQRNIVGEPPSLILPLPLKFTIAVADPSGGAVIDVECRTQLAKLLAELRKNGQNPG